MDIVGATAAVSALGKSIYAGAVYIFTHSGSIWSQQAELFSSDGTSYDEFGTSIVLSSDGNTAIIGAPRKTYNSNSTGYANIVAAYHYGSKPYPAVGDWGGSQIDTIGLYDEFNGQFFLRNSNTAGSPDEQFVLGVAKDEPITGRWTAGASSDGVGVFRPINGLLLFRNALSTGFADYVMVLGIPGDVGLAGNWNAGSHDSPGVYRPSSQLFLLSNTICGYCSVFADYVAQLGN